MTATEATAEAAAQEQAPLDCGDYAWVVYWRAFGYTTDPNNGTWEVGSARILSVGLNGVVCHEVTNRSTAYDDRASDESLLRWTNSKRIFRTREEAATAARDLPPPK